MRLVTWTDPDLKTILVLRLILLLDKYDVSYCIGRMVDGALVDVQLPFNELPRSTVRHAIVKHAKRANLFVKKLDIFSAIWI